FNFTGNPGLRVQMTETSPLSYFSLFFNGFLMDLILNDTNRYAENASGQSDGFQSVTLNELWVFFAMFIIIGLVQKPTLKDYWTTEFVLQTPSFGHLMPCKRFFEILRFLHFVDNRDHAQYSHGELWKIQSVLDHIHTTFKQVYIPEKNISIGESLMLNKGRLASEQYTPAKGVRFGIKFYALCESGVKRSGYIWNFLVYQGKGTTKATHQVVKGLLQGLEGKGYCLWMDRSYCSPNLFSELQHLQFEMCGTVMPNIKNMPQDLLKNKLKKGEVEPWVSDTERKMQVVRWMDKREIFMLTTMHNSSLKETGKSHWQTAEKIKKPVCVVEYNKNICGVHTSDQMMKTYQVMRNSRKWYIKFFFHLMDMCIFNAYVLYDKMEEQTTHYQFRLSLWNEILQKWKAVVSSKEKTSSTKDPPTRLEAQNGHYLIPIPPTEKKTNPCRWCRVCSARAKAAFQKKGQKRKAGQRGGARDTRYMCDRCKVPLCVTPCHKIYHTELNYAPSQSPPETSSAESM
ncbi:piggyBac transposable element-derived protein 4-like, partial [Huso huso]